MGKTSLVRAALRRLPKREWVCACADLWPTDNEAMFVTAVAKAITESMSNTAGKALKIAEDRIHDLCVMTQGHLFYTQHLCHALWERCEPGREVTANLLHLAVETLLERESYAYSTL